MKRNNSMKSGLAVLILLTGAVVFNSFTNKGGSSAWIAPTSAEQLTNPFAGNADATKAGKKLYKSYCALCHGDAGKGDGVAAVALTPKPANFTKEIVQSQSDGAIFWKMTEGRAPMASYKDALKEEQRWQLVNYIRELGSKN